MQIIMITTRIDLTFRNVITWFRRSPVYLKNDVFPQ